MWAPSGPTGPAGWDRHRVGARLRAALAGLQELQGLRATQQARVRGALGLHPAPGPRGQELRLEAVLTALREQLWRLRRQDAGLKTHLDQLDQQISELQLDVSRSSCEAPDSDSRPSSGFYELSDAGSCSLSTSCASVCSDRVSPSLGSWLPVFQTARSRPGMGDWRPRSADETTVPTWSPQPRGEGSRPLYSVEDAGRPEGALRPRPVSTGDLERVLPADLGLQRARPDTTSSSVFCQGIQVPGHALDPKYQRDLVARGGQEVYPYPSPLHAVALQSPLFALPKEVPQPDSHSPLGKPPLSPGDMSETRTRPIRELGPAEAYIDRLLRLRGRGSPSRADTQGPPSSDTSPLLQKPFTQRSDSGQQGHAPLVDALPPNSLAEEEATPWNHSVGGEASVSPFPCPEAQQPHSGYGQRQILSPSRPWGPESPPLAPATFAHLPCTASEASPTKLMGGPQSKAVKVRRRVSDKVPRLGKQLPPRQAGPQGTQAAPRPPLGWDPVSRAQMGGLCRRPTPARESTGRSCSESTLFPVPFFVPLLTRQDGHHASSQALFPGEAAPLGSAARRKQRRWKSTMEISAKAHPGPGPNLGSPSTPDRRAGGPQSRPTLARQDACVSESDPSEHSAECPSLFHSTIAETSEEDTSDHTVNCFGDQESSSSDSDGRIQHRGSGLAMGSVEAGGRAWPRAVPQQPSRAPGGSRPPLPPVPKLCRIKASKALKKKIRRFQPAALKVMTMV